MFAVLLNAIHNAERCRVVGRQQWMQEMEVGIVRTVVRNRGKSFEFPNFNFSSSFS